MPQAIQLEVEMPGDLARFRLPRGVQKRLQTLLDKQDQGQALTAAEKREAEGLVDLIEFLSLLRLRAMFALKLNRPVAQAIRQEEVTRHRHPPPGHL